MPGPNPQPIRLIPLVQDLLTLSPDLPKEMGRSAGHQFHRPPQGPVGGGTFADRATPFAPKGPLQRGCTFTPQDPPALGLQSWPDTAESATLLHRVEDRLARFVHMPSAITFPSKEAAIHAALGAALQPGDAVILDAALYSAMLETVLTLKAHPLRSPSGSVAGVERRLSRLSCTPGVRRVWVAVPALSPHASTLAEIADLADLCHHHGAGLIIDASQDIGLVGQDGGGVIEVQGCHRRADLVLGSFAQAFGAAGGFVASRDPALARVLQRAQTPAHAVRLAPTHAAAILAALDLIDSVEGQRRRRRLHGLSLRLRNHLMAEGVPVLGQASPIVPVRLAPRTALACTALMHRAGIGLRLLQAPVVAGHTPRWCLHLTADHSPADIDTLAGLIRDVTRALSYR